MTNDAVKIMRMNADRIFRNIHAFTYEDHYRVSQAARYGLWTATDLIPANRYATRRETT